MSYWEERIKTHPSMEILSTLDSQLSIAKEHAEQLGSEAIGDYERLRSIVQYIRSHIGACDPELIPAASLQNMVSALTTTVNDVNSFINTKAFQHLRNANNHIENILPNIASLPYPIEPPRVLRRLQPLREWSHEQVKQVFT